MSLTKVTYSMILGAPVNVLDFGAVGDGTSDDTVAIQSAIATGKTVYFPQPTSYYNVATNITIDVPVVAGLYRVFGGAGNVVFSANTVTEIYPEWFGVVGDNTTFNDAAMTKCVTAAKTAGLPIKFSTGTYLFETNFPIGQEPPVTSVIDYNGMVICGTGKTSIIKTIQSTGADVFRLSGAANLTIKDIGVAADISGGSTAGSNGVSLSHGSNNITVQDVYFYLLPYLDKTSYLDGGKAVTIQQTGSLGINNIRVINNVAEGGAYGFDYTGSGAAAINSDPVEVLVEGNIFKNFYKGIVFETTGFVGAEAVIPSQSANIIGNKILECQVGASIGGSTNVNFNSNQIVSTLSTGGGWFAADTTLRGIDFLSNFRSNVCNNTVHMNASSYYMRVGGGFTAQANSPSTNCNVIGNICSGNSTTGISTSTNSVYGYMIGSTVFANSIVGASTAISDKLGYLFQSGKILTGGDFSSSTGWTLGTGWTITGGSAVATSVTSQAMFSDVSLEAGRNYICSVETTGYSGSGTAGFYIYDETSTENLSIVTQINGNGTYTRVFTPSYTSVYRFGLVTSSTAYTASHDNLIVRPLP